MNGPRHVLQRVRRALIAVVLTVPLLMTGLAAAAGTAHAGQPAQADPAGSVDPFIGTGPQPPHTNYDWYNGDVFPGAVAPHGMLAWSPDTPSNIPGGYWHPDSSTTGFSLTHFSGRGCDYQNDVPFIPFSGAVTQSPVAAPSAYRSTFSHSNEHASPGYYDVTLDSGNRVQLTAATHSGLGVFSYADQPESSLLINAGGSAKGDAASGVRIDPAQRRVTGSATAEIGCGSDNYTVYFVTEFDRGFSSYGTWNGKTLQPGTTSSSASKSGAYLTFDTSGDRKVVARTALSYVSVDNAEANLRAEIDGWDQQTVRAATTAAWNKVLSTVDVSGGSDTARRIFYTALYHVYIEPNVFNDVNGQYMGFDDKVHTVEPGHTQYSDITTWDGYRSFIPLLALLSPDEASDVIQSLVNDAQQDGPGLPRWEQANRNSAGMIADDPDPYVANAYAFGARGFDQAAALHAMDLGASQVGTLSGGHKVRSRGGPWLDKHYVPNQAAVSLEYATDDFSIAQYARTLGHDDLYRKYMTRAQYWQNVFNPATKHVQPKDDNGRFSSGFDPASGTGFTEGNSAQYTPMIPFNVHGLANAMGGDKEFAGYLDDLFTKLNAGPSSPYDFHGNEPDEQSPWEYDYAHMPWKTQQVIRQIQTELYTDAPGGLPGNDDAGALSSWYVWSALGMYPITPGTADLVLGSPVFPHAVVHRDNGRPITIDGRGAAPNAPYVQQLKLDGRAWPKAYVPASVVENGGSLDYTLGTEPNTDWATGANAVPPSYSTGEQPAIAYTDPAGTVIAGQDEQVPVTLGAQNVTDSPERVSWTADVPSGVTLSRTSGTLDLAPSGSGTDKLTVATGFTTGRYRITLHLRTQDGSALPDHVLEVAVTKPGELWPYFDNAGVSDDAHQDAAEFDGSGYSYSAQALAKDGVTPGADVTAGGMTYTWPDVPAGQLDNVVAGGQTVQLAQKAGVTEFGLLGSATGAGTHGASGTMTLHYTDGSTAPVTLGMSDWTLGGGKGTPQFGNVVAATTPYRNNVGGQSQLNHTTYLFSSVVPVDPGKTLSGVTLPSSVSGGQIHVFSIAVR